MKKSIEHLSVDPYENLSEFELHEQVVKEVRQQYQENVVSLNQAKAIEFSPQQNCFGIRDEWGNFYPLPTPENIIKTCEKNWELVREKWLQGFTKLQLTPFALPLASLFHSIKRTLISRDTSNTLFFTQPYEDVHVTLHRNEAHIIEDRYLPLARTEFVYFPKNFALQGAITKAEVIADTQDTLTPGWSVCFIEDLPFFISDKYPLPPKHGRHTLTTNCSGNDYLRKLRTKEYQGESVFALEDGLTRFLLRLIQTGEVSCNWKQHSIEMCAGTCVVASGLPTRISWEPTAGQLVLMETREDEGTSFMGCRTAVRLT